MRCPKCGEEIAAESKYCEYCGNRVVNKTLFKIKGLGIFLLIVGSLLNLYVLFFYTSIIASFLQDGYGTRLLIIYSVLFFCILFCSTAALYISIKGKKTRVTRSSLYCCLFFTTISDGTLWYFNCSDYWLVFPTIFGLVLILIWNSKLEKT